MIRTLGLVGLVFTWAAAVSVFGISSADAAFTLTGSTYNQSFNTLGSTTSTTSLPWANDSTIQGWSLFRAPAPGTAIPTYLAHDGSVNNGSFYSFGSGGNSDRALGGTASGGAYFGSPVSGAVAGWIAASFTNGTGFVIDSFTVGYTGEQWRMGSNATAQTMALQFGFGSTFTGVATWISPGAAFNFTSLINATTAATALDGNAAANRTTGIGGTISSLNWAVNDTLWIRWIENNDAGNDHGLAIDDFSISTHQLVPVPLPAAAVIFMGVAGLAGASRRRIQSLLN